MAIPPLKDDGDLPSGVYRATLADVLRSFGSGSAQRKAVALRLERVYATARASGYLARAVVFGSFVTAKAEPNDVDLFLPMVDEFNVTELSGETALLFEHSAAQAHFGASVFWLRKVAAWEGEQAAIEYWQATRGAGARGIIELIEEEA